MEALHFLPGKRLAAALSFSELGKPFFAYSCRTEHSCSSFRIAQLFEDLGPHLKTAIQECEFKSDRLATSASFLLAVVPSRLLLSFQRQAALHARSSRLRDTRSGGLPSIRISRLLGAAGGGL